MNYGKNIVEVVMNNKGEVAEKVADYIGVASFAAVIESLYRECLENFDDAEDMEEYIADLYGKNIQSLAWEFTHKVNREMKKYLHLNDQRMDGNLPICTTIILDTLQVRSGRRTTMATITTILSSDGSQT